MPESTPNDLSPQTAPETLRRDLCLVLAVGLLLGFFGLGTRDLWTSGEARVAQCARQMLEPGGDWIIPQLGEDIRLKKPPLAYWLTALASLPFGEVDEWTSRIPNALAYVGLLLLLYLFGRKLAGARCGLLAAGMGATTTVLWTQSHTTGIEMPLLLFNTLALFAWWQYHSSASANRAGSIRWLLLTYFAIGLSLLQKGPVGPPLILLIILTYQWLASDWRKIAIWHHLAGLAICLAIALPWPLAIYLNRPTIWEKAWKVWFHESGGRFIGFDHIKTSFYFHFKCLSDGMPWILLAPLAILLLTARYRRRLLALLVAGEVLFLSLDIAAKICKAYADKEGLLWSFKSTHAYAIFAALGCLLLAPAAVVLWRRLSPPRSQDDENAPPVFQKQLLFVFVWAVTALIFFSIPASKKSYYVLPIYPALCLLAAAIVERGHEESASHGRILGVFKGLGYALLTLSVLAYPAWQLAEHLRSIEVLDYSPIYSEHLWHLVAYAIAVFVVGCLFVRFAGARRLHHLVVTTMGLSVAIAAFHLSLMPARNDHKANKAVSLYLKPRLQEEDLLYLYATSGTPIFKFYLDHEVNRVNSPSTAIQAMGKATNPMYILFDDEDLFRLAPIYFLKARGDAWPADKALRRLPDLNGYRAYTFDMGFDEDAPPAIEEAKAASMVRLQTLLGGTPVQIVPFLSCFKRIPHPDVRNKAVWHKLDLSPLQNSAP